MIRTIDMTLWIGAMALVGTLVPGTARADHSHHHEASAPQGGGTEIGASVGLIAAQYTTTSFVGDYQGVVPGARWSYRRFGASTNLGIYRLTRNGARYHGIGDLMVSGQASLVGEAARSAGVAMAVSAPTGSERDGLGMGHVMVMPAVWGTWSVGQVTVAASGGYGRAIGASSSGGHVHGSGPVVDPMNFSELTWSASGDVAVAQALRLGARVGGAVALGSQGTDRVIGAARAVWTAGRVDTTAEVQVGLVGDPFNVRGIVETALRF